MNLSKISMALVALATGTAAFAAAPTRIAYSAGATAVQGNQEQALNAICAVNNPGYTVSKLRQSSATNDNFAAYVCASGAVTLATYATATYADFSPNIPFQEIRYHGDQGSFAAVLQVNLQPLAFFNPATNSNLPAGVYRPLLGGVLDTQPTAFPGTTIGANVVTPGQALGVAQAFGVAVSQPLYVAMYNAQLSAGSATVSKPIPASCGAGNALTTTGQLECVPSISKGQMATIMTDNPFNAAASNGAAFLGGPANTELGYARRVDTSGTQSAAQNYFLGLPCSTATIAVVPQGTSTGTLVSPLLRVYGLGSTGNVRTVLNDTSKYSIGVVSGENNQTAQTWKWLRVQGAALGENATPASAGITNRAPVINGSYDFYFEAVFQTPLDGDVDKTAGDNYWADVKAAFGNLALPLGVGLIDPISLANGYNKGGLSCQGNVSN